MFDCVIVCVLCLCFCVCFLKMINRRLQLTSLTPGMLVTGEWSRLSQATCGGGSPRARHATAAPELLVNVTTPGGGSTSMGPAGAVDVRTPVAAPVIEKERLL